MKKIILSTLALALTGCMSENEFLLRQMNAKNQANYKPTYEVIRVKGPLTIPENGEFVINAPNQPFVPLSVPDGMAVQQAVIRDTITGAVIGYGIYQAGKAHSGNTYNTTNNNAGGAQ